jgi:hypothetical protein
MLFIMLNPSTADGTLDDPTIRRCKAFAAREGCDQVRVVNLFALRATNPRELAKSNVCAIGPDTDHHIREEVRYVRQQGGVVVAAWGANPMASHRDLLVAEMVGPMMCLGITKDGFPRHPLYVKADQPLVPYELDGYGRPRVA